MNTIYKGTDKRLRLSIREEMDNQPIDLTLANTEIFALIYVRGLLQARYALNIPVGSDYRQLSVDAQNTSDVLIELQDDITKNWPTGAMWVGVFVTRDNTDYSDDREKLLRVFRGYDVISSNIADV